MSLKHLTDVQIRKLAAPDKGQKVYYEPSGLGIRVSQGGSKSFVIQVGKARKRITLGRYPAMSLQEARKAAFRLTDEPSQKNATTALSTALTGYLAECEEKNRPSTIKEYRRMLALIPDKPLDQVSKADLDNPASHQITAWRTFFNWCLKHELATRNPFNHHPTPIGKRERVLTPDELITIWHYEDPPFTDIVKLLLLTGQRRSDIWKLQPKWIDGDFVVIPAASYKTNRTHVFPIGTLAKTYIEKAPFTFNGWSKSKARMDKVTGVENWRLHDLRRTFVTIHASEHIRTPIEVVEKIVGHREVTGGMVAIYNRYSYLNEMKLAMVAWETYLRKLFRML